MTQKKITETAAKSTKVDLTDTIILGLRLRVKKKGKYFYFEYRHNGRKRSISIGRHGAVTVDQARKAAGQYAGKVALGTDPLKEKEENRILQAKQKQNSLRSFLESGFRDVTPEKNYKYSKKRIEKHFADFLDIPLTEITSWKLNKWKKNYRGKPSGGNRILTTLRGVLSKAQQAGLIDLTPMTEVKKIKEDKSPKIRSLSHEEELKVLEALDDRQADMRKARENYIRWCKERNKEPPMRLNSDFTDHLKPMVLTALNAGLRRGEVFNLKVVDLNFSDRILTVRGTESKSQQTRQIPINETLASILTTWLEQTGNKELVFPSPKTGERFDNIDNSWNTLCEFASLVDVRFHDLRHTFGTKLAHANIDLVTIKELMGHESLETTERYLHTNNKRKREAVAVLEVA